jgi:uncharacterized phiE125 gp8 family phage protein
MATQSPAAMAVTVAEAKAYLRIANSDEDASIAGFLRTASALCEAFTGLALVRRQVVEVIGASPAWSKLGAGPVQAIEEVTAIAADGTETLIDTAGYAVDIDANGDGWVRVTAAHAPERVRVEYVAGLAADWNGVPEPLRQGVLRLATHLYTGRGDNGGAPPAAITALWRPWRRIRLG